MLSPFYHFSECLQTLINPFLGICRIKLDTVVLFQKIQKIYTGTSVFFKVSNFFKWVYPLVLFVSFKFVKLLLLI